MAPDAKLVAPDRAPGDEFGVELGIEGDLALASEADGGLPPATCTRSVARPTELAARRGDRGPEGVGSTRVRAYARSADGSAVMPPRGPIPAGVRSGSTRRRATLPGAHQRVSGTEVDGRFGAVRGGRRLPAGGRSAGVRSTRRGDRFHRASADWQEVGIMVDARRRTGDVFGSVMHRGADGSVWVAEPGTGKIRGAVVELRQTEAHLGAGRDDRDSGTGSNAGVGGAFQIGEISRRWKSPATTMVWGRARSWSKTADHGSWRRPSRFPSKRWRVSVGRPSHARRNGRRLRVQGRHLLSFMPVQSIGGTRGVELSGIWGWTDPETGRECALVGPLDGAAFVDVTDPANPVYVGRIADHQGGPSSGATSRSTRITRTSSRTAPGRTACRCSTCPAPQRARAAGRPSPRRRTTTGSTAPTTS